MIDSENFKNLLDKFSIKAETKKRTKVRWMQN